MFDYKSSLKDLTHRISQLPISLWISLMTVGLIAFPALSQALEYDRVRVQTGEVWRMLTSHFVHWDLQHLGWDTVTFLALGWALEQKSRSRFVACLSLSAFGIATGIWWFALDLQRYRGLSGIDTALFVALAVTILEERWRERAWGWVIGIAGLLLCLLGKTLFEFWTGSALFVQSAGSTFTPTPLAHVVGAAVGLLVAIWPAVGVGLGAAWKASVGRVVGSVSV